MKINELNRIIEKSWSKETCCPMSCDDWSIFTYWLKPSYNLYQNLLWHREKIEVLEPISVREEMKGIVEKIKNQYL